MLLKSFKSDVFDAFSSFLMLLNDPAYAFHPYKHGLLVLRDCIRLRAAFGLRRVFFGKSIFCRFFKEHFGEFCGSRSFGACYSRGCGISARLGSPGSPGVPWTSGQTSADWVPWGPPGLTSADCFGWLPQKHVFVNHHYSSDLRGPRIVVQKSYPIPSPFPLTSSGSTTAPNGA